MFKITKNLLSLFLCAILVITAIPLCFAEGSSPTAPTDLKVELLTNPLGIDTNNPAFSWVVNDADAGESQTSYQIKISSTSALEGDVLDTGWVTSVNNRNNHEVHITELPSKLVENELYYWQVRTKDKDGNSSPYSEAAYFMTGLGSQWSSLKGVWSPSNPGAVNTWGDVIVEQSISVLSGDAFAVLGRMDVEGKNGYMFQLRNVDNVIKIHRVVNGSINTTAFSTVNLSDKGITLPKGTDFFKIKIEAAGANIGFYIDVTNTGNNYVFAGTVNVAGQGNLTSGYFGYRTGNRESGCVDNLLVTDLSGVKIYSNNFDSDDKCFTNVTVADGVMSVGKSIFSTYRRSNLIIEQDIAIRGGGAIAMLVRMDRQGKNGYMVQLRNADNVIKFHKITDGSINTTAFSTVDLAGKVTLPADGVYFRFKTYTHGTLTELFVDLSCTGNNYVHVGVLNAESQGDCKGGFFGYRTGGSESANIDNIRVTRPNGELLFESDFSSPDQHFSNAECPNGYLYIGAGKYAMFSDPNESVSGLANFAFLRSPNIKVVSSDVDKVVVSIAAKGTAKDRATISDLYFNGKCLGAGSARELENVGSFEDGTGYTRVYYNSYDVTSLLNDSKGNIISAIGNCMDPERGILIQMTAFYKDGTKKILANSGSDTSNWRALDGTAAFGDKGQYITTGYVTILNENINSHAYPYGWNEISFDSSGWRQPVSNGNVADYTSGTTGRVLYPFGSENALRVETNEPTKKVYVNKAGNVIVDLGKEIIGGMKININLPKDAIVTVHMGEEMKDDGTVKYQLTAFPIYSDIWSLRKGVNAFETVTMRNFRYIEFIGFDSEVKNLFVSNPDWVMGWAIQQPFDDSESYFEATDGSDAAILLNRLYELSKYTIKATNQDLFVDSQARERAAYEGDLLVNSNTSYSVSSNYTLARHSNEWLIDNPTWPNDYTLFSVEMAYLDFLYTGNNDSLNEYYKALKKKLTAKVAVEDATTGLIRCNDSQAGTGAIIDWPSGERDGYQKGYYDVIINCEYVGIYNIFAKICSALGKPAESATYTNKANTLKNALIKYAYNSTNGKFYDSLSETYAYTNHCSTHATAYALAYGVFDNQDMADKMCNFVYSKCEDHFMGSVYFSYFILKGLYNGNHGEMAEKLITNPQVGENVKTFASLLDDLNCTITPEAWGHKWKTNMTLSHPWGASPGCSIVQGMFGIYPTTEGFKTFDIKLQPGDIKSAKVKTPSVKGSIEVAYELKGNNTYVTATVPVNSVATIYIPCDNTESVLWVDNVKKTAQREGKYLKLNIYSGTHDIVTEGPAPEESSQETSSAVSSETVTVNYGDVDKNGEITSADALMVLQTAVKKITLTEEQVKVADVDGNGEVTSADALYILQYAVNKIDQFPIEK